MTLRSMLFVPADSERKLIAIHPDQVDAINAAFSPSEDETASAKKIVDAFAARPDAGTLSIDGVMYDMPHLKQARRTLGTYPPDTSEPAAGRARPSR